MISQNPPGNGEKQDLKQPENYGYCVNNRVCCFGRSENAVEIHFKQVNVKEKAN
jgi:hypothetical protein